MRVSDAEREHTVELVREAWLSGRLSDHEMEERVRQAWEARYSADLWHAVREIPTPVPEREPFPAAAGWSAGLSGFAAVAFLVTFSLAFMFTLPLAAAGWLLGLRVRRSEGTRGRGLARFGEVTGLIVADCSLLLFAGCAAIVVVAG